MCTTKIHMVFDVDEPRFELSKKQGDKIVTQYNTADIFDKYVKELYDDRKLSDETQKTLFHSVYQQLKAGVNEGFGQVTAKVEYGTPNFEMLKNLQHNAGVFSMFKNHSMVKEVAGLLKDGDGNLKARQQFITDAKKIDDQYRDQYLKVEYDTAVRASRMAAQWGRIQATKHLYPCLEYMESTSSHPREDHLDYVGITRPVDDSFWDTYYPPNGWRCQCSVSQTDQVATDIPDGLPDVPEDFRFNSGKLGQVYSIENSNYIKSAKPSEIPQLIKQAKAYVNNDIAKGLDYQNYYTPKNSGGSVDVHPLAINNSDFNEVLNSARSLANQGKKIQILPDLNDAELRAQLLPLDKIRDGKNPDYFINEKWVADLKTLNSNSQTAVHRKLSECREQCDNIVINVPKENTIEFQKLCQFIKGKVQYPAYDKFELIWLNYKGKWSFYTRDDILNDKWK